MYNYAVTSFTSSFTVPHRAEVVLSSSRRGDGVSKRHITPFSRI